MILSLPEYACKKLARQCLVLLFCLSLNEIFHLRCDLLNILSWYRNVPSSPIIWTSIGSPTITIASAISFNGNLNEPGFLMKLDRAQNAVESLSFDPPHSIVTMRCNRTIAVVVVKGK